jgi:hypothetical protein
MTTGKQDVTAHDAEVAAMQLGTWIMQERTKYANFKFDRDGAEAMRHQIILEMKDYGLTNESTLYTIVMNYLGKAMYFGLDSHKGRQQLGKTIVTLMDYLELAIALFGPMPKPGMSSSDDIDISEEWIEW